MKYHMLLLLMTTIIDIPSARNRKSENNAHPQCFSAAALSAHRA